LAVSSTLTDQRQQTPDRHMWSVDVAALSVDGWQPNEGAVMMRSQRLVTNVPPDTVEQCRPIHSLNLMRSGTSSQWRSTCSSSCVRPWVELPCATDHSGCRI